MTRTYGRLIHEENKWILTTSEAHVVIRLKQMFPRLSRTEPREFVFPDDDVHSADLEWFTHRYPLAMSDPDRARLIGGKEQFETKLADLERILQPDWTPPEILGLQEGQEGRAYQLQAVELLRKAKHLLLGDDVGLGKTYTALLAATFPEMLPMAVVVEPHIQKQWAEKTSEFTTLTSHCVTKTKPYALPQVPIVIFRYSNIHGWTTVFSNGYFKSVVFDEVQNLRTGDGTDKGRSAMVLTKNTRYQLGMSATPIYNMGAEIYEILKFLTPGEVQHPLGRYDEFYREWVSDGKKIKNPTALGAYLRDRHLFLRRTKRDVGQQMDNVTRIPHEVPYDVKEEKKVEDLAQALAIKTISGSFIERGSAARELDMLLRQITGIAKARSVARFVQMIAETGEPVLLAGWHREFYRIVDEELTNVGDPKLKPVYYTGTESPAQKEKSKKDFLEKTSLVMMISLRSGSGLDGIQHVCSTAVIGELDWSPKVHDQLIGRLDREGQKQPVTVFFLHAEGGSDPSIVELLGLKSHQINGIVDPNIPFAVSETDDSRLISLAREFLRRRGVTISNQVAA